MKKIGEEKVKKEKWISPELYPCDRCGAKMPAYYVLSHISQQLRIQCTHCGGHAAPFVPGLNLPQKPTKEYLEHVNPEAGVVPAKSPEKLQGQQTFL